MTDNSAHTHTCVEVGRLKGEIQAMRRDLTALANENARLRSQLAEADVVISSMRDAIDEADTEAVTR